MILASARLRYPLGALEHPECAGARLCAPTTARTPDWFTRLSEKSPRPFANRADAGARLGEALRAWHRQKGALVVGIPRGGAIVAAELARVLDLPFHTWISQKLQAPGDPLQAIGSLGEDGEMIVDETTLRAMRVPHVHLLAEVRRQRTEVARRVRLYREESLEAPDCTGRRVLLVDDGMASGATMQAAVRGLRRQKPAFIMVAVPAALPLAVQRLAEEADEVIALQQPAGSSTVAKCYVEFPELDDTEVLRSLRREVIPLAS